MIRHIRGHSNGHVWSWAMGNECYICDAHATLRWRRCVTAMKKKILSKENFFAISNIVQNSVGKQLGKLFFLRYANWNKLCLSCTTDCA